MIATQLWLEGTGIMHVICVFPLFFHHFILHWYVNTCLSPLGPTKCRAWGGLLPYIYIKMAMINPCIIMIWYDMIWYDMIYDMIWYLIWYDMMWYDMIWYSNMIYYDIIYGVCLNIYYMFLSPMVSAMLLWIENLNCGFPDVTCRWTWMVQLWKRWTGWVVHCEVSNGGTWDPYKWPKMNG